MKLRSTLGVSVCSAAALLTSLMFRGTRVESSIPVAFLLLIFLVVLYFGTVAGTLSTIFACVIFMLFLFEPIRSFVVHDPQARSSLIWMVLGGLAISNLFVPPPTDKGDQIQPAPAKPKHFTTGA